MSSKRVFPSKFRNIAKRPKPSEKAENTASNSETIAHIKITGEEDNSAFNGSLERIDIKTPDNSTDWALFLQFLQPKLKEEFNRLLKKYHGFKFNIIVCVEYCNVYDRTIAGPGYLRTRASVITNTFQQEEIIDQITQALTDKNANFIREKSGLVIKSIDLVTINAAKHLPLAASGFSDLPKFLKNKHCIINIQNTDDRCFGYATLAGLGVMKANNPQRPFAYNALFASNKLNQITYPVEPQRIPEIEQQLEISYNIFSFFDDEGKARYPLYISKTKFPRKIDLLYWNNHYAHIHDFQKFMTDITKHHGYKFFCKRCLGHFSDNANLSRHDEFCSREDFTSVLFTMPPVGTFIKYKNIRYQLQLPFVIYADFECLTSPLPKAINKKT